MFPSLKLAPVALLALSALGWNSRDRAEPVPSQDEPEASFALVSSQAEPEASFAALLPNALIVCNGSACGGTGGAGGAWDYLYHVQPGDTGVDMVVMGVHTPNLNLQNALLPGGWTVSVQQSEGLADRRSFIPHGQVTSITGGCPWSLVWQGPCQTQPFDLGFKKNWTYGPAHEVEWVAFDCVGTNTTFSDWTRPVGAGAGPVHTPYAGWVPASPEGDEAASERDHADCAHADAMTREQAAPATMPDPGK